MRDATAYNPPVEKTAAQEAFDEGMRHFEAGDLRAAAAAFERALVLAPRFERAHYQLGNVRQDEECWSDAEVHFRAALAITPEHAEAHNNLGVVLQVMAQPAEAEASYVRAAELKPALSQPYLNLGRLLEQLGRRADAIDAFRAGLERSAEPETFRHLLAALQDEVIAGRAPAEYVRRTFDGFAAQFDRHLVERFDYRVPEAIAAVLPEVRRFAPASADVLDLGCGTGLSGMALRGIARSLTGVDLAPRMLEQARARGCYGELSENDLLAWMHASAEDRFDVIVAADVLVYFGALEPVFAEAARLARAGALFAFSIEVCEGQDWRLGKSGRYAQSAAYIRRLAAEHGFTVAIERDQRIRKPLVGLLYVLARSPVRRERAPNPGGATGDPAP
jgi:predicted TPR repeat methyltransferase